ncbi:hypothetical protein M9H77_02163 [Catharanthus roseus]|uniref:Uncharacterized protein n=1 Tax=Catharanthus roseus TaxID=4058 RepID=A0ACC0C834_CATRO|nr:hypothetical protein M9H77_02163 [Catharanthus roseus]
MESFLRSSFKTLPRVIFIKLVSELYCYQVWLLRCASISFKKVSTQKAKTGEKMQLTKGCEKDGKYVYCKSGQYGKVKRHRGRRCDSMGDVYGEKFYGDIPLFYGSNDPDQ